MVAGITPPDDGKAQIFQLPTAIGVGVSGVVTVESL